MSGFLLDTCAISEATKRAPNPGLREWMQNIDPARAYLSVVTLGELRKGVALQRNASKAARLESWLTVALPKQFENRILPFDADVADRWGRLIAALQPTGVVLSPIDSLLAATALHHNLSLVTRNDKDFRRAGISIANPWSGEA